ncbi:hypothetical protein SBC1_61050 (plasmid) [Caballeronia sp. SBC1]|uniref:hypothetical protein n=1 Tax=unclassified Caballeronia TaxID=2646786 RepID=UPI0013E15044|nr:MULTISPECIES: hypothetical protein [unclassified Caballeronia]QIE27993.1 hypothetical protein SBC2_60680 [Caballeronia sp. SBC2]QIN66059.1 hypothetical protein SBC1_61050 [Caballeronia sp. SBC1]
MFGSLLNNIVSVFSKNFLIASFLPVLAFTFMNGAALYVLFEPWHQWGDQHVIQVKGVGDVAFLTGVLAIALIVLSYLVSSITNSLRRIMEGNWPEWIAHLFSPAQERRLSVIEGRIAEAVVVHEEIESRFETVKDRLIKARKEGEKKSTCYQGDPKLEQMIDELQRMRSQNRLLDTQTLFQAVSRLEYFLQENNVSALPPAKRSLSLCHMQIHDLMAFGLEQAELEYVRLQNVRNSNFGTFLAPTRMGNIANSIQAYAERRYRCNLDSVVSNLQWCIQQSPKGYSVLQDAKMQLDFLIICSWLTLVWTLIWLFILGILFPSAGWFLLVALAGPVISYGWYIAAAEQYRAFNDVLSTSLDIYRFDLLKALHMPMPSDVEEERLVWGQLDRLADTEGGERHNFRFEHSKT